MKGLGVFKDWEVCPFYCKCSVDLVLPSLRGLNNESLICEEESLDAWCIPRFVIRGYFYSYYKISILVIDGYLLFSLRLSHESAMFAVSTLMDFMTVNTFIVFITVNTRLDFMTESVFFFVSSKPLPTSLILMKTRSSSAFVAGVVVQALFHLKPSSSRRVASLGS